jgi:hypothetical protein
MNNNRKQLHTDNTPRRCSRCRQSLTDPASRESGVGPNCRKKDTHLYAKSIKANFGLATIRALSIHDHMLAPECLDAWHNAVQKLLKASEKVANVTDDIVIMERTGADLRDVMRVCDMLCSYEHPDRDVRSTVVDIVQACGYVGLASVLSGEASTSPSRIWFENGRVYMTGLGNKSGFITMKKIPGILTPKYRGDRSPYSAPASQVESFVNNIQRYWPMYEGDLTDIVHQVKQWIADNSNAADIVTDNTNSALSFVVTTRSQDFTVKFPWVRNANMFGLTNQFKTIPANNRSYDATNHVWSFTIENLDQILDMARNSNIFNNVQVVKTEDPTPVGMYGKHNVNRRTYRQQNTWHSTWRGR